MAELHQAIAARLIHDVFDGDYVINPEQGKLRAAFYNVGAVVDERMLEDGQIALHLRCPQSVLDQVSQESV